MRTLDFVQSVMGSQLRALSKGVDKLDLCLENSSGCCVVIDCRRECKQNSSWEAMAVVLGIGDGGLD